MHSGGADRPTVAEPYDRDNPQDDFGSASRSPSSSSQPPDDPTTRSLVLCSEGPPSSSRPGSEATGTDTRPPVKEKKSKAKKLSSKKAKEGSSMYFFHSSHVPADDGGSSGGRPSPRGTSAPRSPTNTGAALPVSGPCAHTDAGTRQPVQHPPHQPSPVPPSHYSLGRLSNPPHTTHVADPTPTGAAAGPASALCATTLSSTDNTPVPEVPASTQRRQPACANAGNGSVRDTSPASLYEHTTSGPELLAALRRKTAVTHSVTPTVAPRMCKAPVGAPTTGPQLAVYSGLQPRPSAEPAPAKGSQGLATTEATAPNSPPSSSSLLNVSSASTSGIVLSSARPSQSILQPLAFHGSGLAQPSSSRNIPYSTDSPSRSALPSHENSYTQIPMSAAPLPAAPTSAAAAAQPPAEGCVAAMAGALPPLPPPPPSVAAMTCQVEPAADRAVAREEAEEEEQHAADAVGLEPVLAQFMPKGRYVVMNLLATWGDEHEVGLCAVEFFDERGVRVLPPCGYSGTHAQPPQDYNGSGHEGQTQQHSRLSPPPEPSAEAVPPCTQSLSVDHGVVTLGYHTSAAAASSTGAERGKSPALPSGSTSGSGGSGTGIYVFAEYTATGEEMLALADASSVEAMRTDRRRQLASLLLEKCNTHDEEEMFAMPFTAGHHHLVCFMFPHPVTLSMIRLVNYCGQGRVHTTKGARVVEITMDDVCVFRGEVGQHSGAWLTDPSQEGIQDCENILFTDDHQTLQRIMTRRARGRPLEGGGTVSSPWTWPAASAEEEAAAASNGDADDGKGGADAPVTSTVACQRRSQGGRRSGGVTLVIRNRHWDDLDDMTTTHSTTARMLSSSTTGVGFAAGAAADLPLRPASMDGGLLGPASSRLAVQSHSPDHQQQQQQLQSSKGNRRQQSASLRCPPGQELDSTSAAVAMPASGRGRNAWGVGTEGEGGAATGAGVSAKSGETAIAKPRKPAQYPNHCPTNVTSACILLLTTWGDVRQVGLSALRLRDGKGNSICQSVARWTVQYPDGAYSTAAEQAELSAQAQHLLDENAATACALPFAPAMQLIMEFAAPIPSLGFLEVANYSVGEKTFCGAKEVRLFLSDGAAGLGGGGGGVEAAAGTAAAVYRYLWTLGVSSTSRRALQRARVFEVTPCEGVSLRKAPAHLAVPRFQTYDLSLQAPGPLEAAASAVAGGSPLSPSSRDDVNFSARYHISSGPGTGGTLGGSVGALHGGCGGHGGGGMRFFSGTSSFANSLNASMNIRAAMAMKRARMSLRERPAWLLEYQPYITPLLPVGYVLKVRLAISARSVGQVPQQGRPEGKADDPSGGSATPFYLASQVVLKAYLKDWVVDPFAACSFVNESGTLIQPTRPGEDPPPATATTKAASAEAASRTSSDEEEDGLPAFIPMVAESVLTMSPTPGTSTASAAASQQPPQHHLNVVLELVYVADTPFCLSVVNLRRPLVLDGSAAWVRHVQVCVDDALVFDSGDAVLELKRPKTVRDGDSGDSGNGPGRHHGSGRAAGASSRPSVLETAPHGSTMCEALTAGLDLVQCATSLKEHIVFTLDGDLLGQLKEKIRSSS